MPTATLPYLIKATIFLVWLKRYAVTPGLISRWFVDTVVRFSSGQSMFPRDLPCQPQYLM